MSLKLHLSQPEAVKVAKVNVLFYFVYGWSFSKDDIIIYIKYNLMLKDIPFIIKFAIKHCVMSLC